MIYEHIQRPVPLPALAETLDSLSREGWETVCSLAMGQTQSRIAGAGPAVPTLLMLFRRPVVDGLVAREPN